MMKRHLHAAPEPCPFGCVYCFAGRRDYVSPPAADTFIPAGGELTVVYPACDGELLLLPDLAERLDRLDRAIAGSCVVSVSTKAAVNVQHLRELAAFDKRLRDTGRGFVKAAVSFATAHNCAELEPGTADFQERVAVLAAFHAHGLVTGLTLKPLLPFIEAEEYGEIIDACAPFTSAVLLGDLYVSDDAFFRRAIAGRYPVAERKISWLAEHPVWLVVESQALKESLRAYIRQRGLIAADSDVELIRDLSTHATA